MASKVFTRAVRFGIAGSIVPIAILVAPAASAAAGPDAWTSSGLQLSNSTVNYGETGLTAANLQRMRLAWQRPDGFGNAGNVIADGVVYVPFVDGGGPGLDGIRAIRIRDGDVLWSLGLYQDRPGQVDPSRALILSGHILYAAGDSQDGAGIDAINLTTHRIGWTTHVSPPPEQGYSNSQLDGLLLDSGHLYATAGNTLDAFNAATGHRLWSIPGQDVGDEPKLLGAADGVVFYQPNEGFVAAYDGATGRELWRTSDSAGYSATVADGRLIVQETNRIAAYATSGCGHDLCAPAWSVPLPSDLEATHVSAASDGVVAVALDGDHDIVETLDAATGRLRWREDLPGRGLSDQPLARAGSMLYTLFNTELTAFPVNCAARCTTAIPVADVPDSNESPPSTFAVAQDHVVVQTWPHALYTYALLAPPTSKRPVPTAPPPITLRPY